MDLRDLSPAEKAVVRAAQRLGARWPKTLRLVSVGGGLTIARSDGEQPDRLVAAIPGVPLGGEWRRDRAVDVWWYEFTPQRRDAQYAKLEPAVRLLLHKALMGRQRLSFTEAGWAEFRESAGRCGISLWDVQRTPVLPAEDVP
jgi:hypothetical protein